ncbi:MAG: tetratricopeptide repeat protein [Rudaea sp.]
MAASEHRSYSFGPFQVDVRERTLVRGDEAIDLPPKVFDALTFLLEHAGKLVSKDEFFARLWPKTIVSEVNLNKYIWQIRKALGDDGEHYIATVPKQGYRFVGISASASSPPTPAPSDVASEATTSPYPVPLPVVSNRRRLRWPVYFAGAIVLAVSVLAVMRLSQRAPERSQPLGVASDDATKPSIALLDFADTDANAHDQWLATALSELLGLELAVAEQVHVVPGDSIARVMHNLPPRGATDPGRETLERLRRQLGADLVVAGKYHTDSGDSADPLKLDLTVLDARTGNAIGTFSESGNSNNLRMLVAETGQRLREQLGLNRLSENLATTRDNELAADTETLRYYAVGVEQLRRMDGQAAIDNLNQAVTRSPDFLPASLSLARALHEFGYDQRAVAVAHAALERAGKASRELRLAIEAISYESQRSWPDAVETYDALHRFFPEEIEYAMGLARVQAMAGHNDEAVKTLQQLHASQGQDPRIDLAEAGIAQMRSDWSGERDAAQRAIAGSVALNAPTMQGEALLLHAWALDFLGDKPAAYADYQKAAAIFANTHDAALAARADVDLAGWHYDHGEFDQATELYKRALSTFRNLGVKSGEATALANLASIEYAQDKLLDAWQDTERVLQLRRDLGDPEGEAWSLSALGTIEMERGQTDAALATYNDAVTLNERIGNQANLAWALMSLADLQRLRGEFADARTNAQRAVDIQRKLASKEGEGDTLNRLGIVLRDSGDLTGARTQLQAALMIEQQLKEDYKAASTQVDLARLALREHKPEEALMRLDKTQAGFTGADAESGLATTNATRADALLALGRKAQARTAMNAALGFVKSHPDSLDSLDIRRSEARVLAAEGRTTSAIAELRDVRQRYEQRRMRGQIAQVDRTIKRIGANL